MQMINRISKANEQNEGAHRKVNNQNYQAIIYQFVLQQQEARSQGLAQLQEQQNEVQNKQQNTQYQCSLNQQFGLSQNNKPFLYDYINQESGMLNLSNGGFDYCNLNLNQPNLIQSNSHKLNQSSILLYEHIPQEESLLEIKQIQKRIEDSLQQETNRNGINQEFRFENNMNQYIQKVDNNNNKILDNDESLNSTFQEKFNPTRFLGQINPQNENESQNQVQPTKFMGQINDSSYIRNNIREGINDYDQEEKKESFQGINSSNNLGELNQEEQLNQNRNAEYNQFQKQESEEIGQEDYECTLFSEFTKDEIGMNEVSSESVITFIDKLKQGNKGKIPQVQQEQKLELIKQSEKSYLCKGPEYLIYLLKYEPIIKKMLQVKFIFENNNQLEEKSKKFQQIVFLIVNPNSIEFLKQLVEIVQKYLNVHKSIIEDTQLGRAIYNHKPFRKELRDQKVMIYYNTDQKAMMWYSYSKYTDELEQLAKNYLTKYSFKRVFIQNNFQEKGIKDVKMNQVQINHLNKIAKAREEGLNEFFQHKKSESTAIISMHFQLSKQGIIPNYKYYSNSITFQFKNEDKIFYEEIIDNFRSYIKDRIEYVVKNESNPQGVGQFSYKYVLKNNYLINGIESKSSIEFLNPTAEYNNILPENKKIIDIIREYTTLQPINGVYTLNDQNIKTILQKLDTY